MWWVDWDKDDDSDIFDDLDKLLDEKDADKKTDPSDCIHVWEQIGEGPVTATPWINCRRCGMKKEDYDKERNGKPKTKRRRANEFTGVLF